MTHAYDETYLADAMNALGDMFDCAINDCGLVPEDFFELFVKSDVARYFGHGNPKYVAGLSGVELLRAVIGKAQEVPVVGADKTPEYWGGWAIAYYQWYANVSFADLRKNGLTISKMLELYPTMHEADVSKLTAVADGIVRAEKNGNSRIL